MPKFFHSPAELHSNLPDSEKSPSIVAKQLQMGQSLEVSCDQLVKGETLEEIFYLCTHGVGLRRLEVTVSGCNTCI